MKLLILSDIHGSYYYAKKILEITQKENPDKIALLGDLYYHGPRNPFPTEYNPMKVSEILNSLKENLMCVKGNCDAEVDEMISDFKLEENLKLNVNGYKIFLTHGHKYNMDKLPQEEFDIMMYGHFHVGFIKKQNGKIFANPGSISLPKNDSKNSYLVLQDNNLVLKDIDGNVLEYLNIEK